MKGERIAEEFQQLVEQYVERTYTATAQSATRRPVDDDPCVTVNARHCRRARRRSIRPLPCNCCVRSQDGWRIAEDGKSLRRAFGFKDFYRTMAFVNAVAWIANTEDHHPDMEVGYNYCRIEFSTHTVGGLSENDFICAAKLDAL